MAFLWILFVVAVLGREDAGWRSLLGTWAPYEEPKGHGDDYTSKIQPFGSAPVGDKEIETGSCEVVQISMLMTGAEHVVEDQEAFENVENVFFDGLERGVLSEEGKRVLDRVKVGVDGSLFGNLTYAGRSDAFSRGIRQSKRSKDWLDPGFAEGRGAVLEWSGGVEEGETLSRFVGGLGVGMGTIRNFFRVFHPRCKDARGVELAPKDRPLETCLRHRQWVEGKEWKRDGGVGEEREEEKTGMSPELRLLQRLFVKEEVDRVIAKGREEGDAILDALYRVCIVESVNVTRGSICELLLDIDGLVPKLAEREQRLSWSRVRNSPAVGVIGCVMVEDMLVWMRNGIEGDAFGSVHSPPKQLNRASKFAPPLSSVEQGRLFRNRKRSMSQEAAIEDKTSLIFESNHPESSVTFDSEQAINQTHTQQKAEEILNLSSGSTPIHNSSITTPLIGNRGPPLHVQFVDKDVLKAVYVLLFARKDLNTEVYFLGGEGEGDGGGDMPSPQNTSPQNSSSQNIPKLLFPFGASMELHLIHCRTDSDFELESTQLSAQYPGWFEGISMVQKRGSIPPQSLWNAVPNVLRPLIAASPYLTRFTQDAEINRKYGMKDPPPQTIDHLSLDGHFVQLVWNERRMRLPFEPCLSHPSGLCPLALFNRWMRQERYKQFSVSNSGRCGLAEFTSQCQSPPDCPF